MEKKEYIYFIAFFLIGYFVHLWVTESHKENPFISKLNYDNAISNIEYNLNQLKDKVESLESTTESLDDKFNETKLDLLAANCSTNIVTLNAKIQKGYQIIKFGPGFFFISLDKVEKYLDGYKLYINIGNPYVSKFDDINIIVSWGNSKPKEYQLTGSAFGAKWNKFEIFINPASEKDLEKISIVMDFPKVSLLN